MSAYRSTRWDMPSGVNQPQPSQSESAARLGGPWIEEATERLEKTIATYPVQSIAVALSIGLLVGWWVKRK